MNEIEKRVALYGSSVTKLRDILQGTYPQELSVSRTILIKTEGGFIPDPDDLVDVKIKLIDNASVLSVKQGSWHSASKRFEYETHFRRTDLDQLIYSIVALGVDHFILLSTKRSIWHTPNCIVTIDEYVHADSALIEVEAKQGHNEAVVDEIFKDLELTPMESNQTVAFIEAINSSKGVQIDMTKITPDEVAARMLKDHENAK